MSPSGRPRQSARSEWSGPVRAEVRARLVSVLVCGAAVALVVLASAVPGAGAATDGPAQAGEATTTPPGTAATVPAGTTQRETADVSVTVRGEILANGSVTNEKRLSDGERINVSGDPEVRIDVESDSTIELVSVRVDGRTRRSYVPNASSFSDATVIDLDPGEHDLRVVVEANRTTSFAATLVNDPNGPLATFESPFSAGFVGENGSYTAPDETYTVNRSEVTLEATFRDRVGVDRVVVERTYTGEYGGSSVFERERFRIDDPGGAISQPLRLGLYDQQTDEGTNALNVTLYDKFGQDRRYAVELLVNDSDDPTIEVTDVEPKIEAQAAVIDFTVRDNVGIESVGYRLGDASGFGLQYLLFGAPPIERPVQQSFSQTVRVTDGIDEVTVVAEDGAGHTTNLSRTIDYDSLVRPRIRFVPTETGVVGGRQVRVRGDVFDGQIVRVRVETVAPDGEIIDIVAVHGGSVTENVTVDERLDAGVYPATVRIRAVDTTGAEHVESFQLSQDDTLAASDGSTAVPTPTVTPRSPPSTPQATPARTPTPGSGTTRPQVVVRNATLSASTVDPGATVVVNATVLNRGDGNALYTAGLTVDGNVTATDSVTVPAGANRTVSMRFVANETGTFPVAVNGTSAGNVTVGSRGGLVASVLGVFGFLPLGLLKPLALFVGVPLLVVYLALKGLAIYLGY